MQRYWLRAMLLAASSGAIMAGSARAQTQEPASSGPQTDPTQQVAENASAQDKDIIVTGTRAALETAERIKRDSDVVLDGVSADDIGALPDASMTEAVIRIPGAYANDNGALSARGLGPDFINQQINGRILPSPQAGNRRVQTGSYPTEGLTGLFLQKTPDASTIEGGAGGSILLNTIRPLDTRRDGLDVVVRGYINTNSAKLSAANDFANVAPRISATFVKKITPTLGIALTYARTTEYKASIQNDGSNFRFGTLSRTDLNGNGRGDALPQTLGVQVNASNDFRDSALGMIQWDPTPSTRISLDGFYNRDRFEDYNRRFFAFTLFQGLATGDTITSSTVNEYDTVVAFNGTAGGYRGIVNYTDGKDTTFGGGLNVAFDNGGPISFKIDSSYFKANRDSIGRNFTYENDAANLAGQRLPFSFNIVDPFNSVYNFQPLTIDDYALSVGSISTQKIVDDIGALRADFLYKPEGGFVKSIGFGARIDKRHKTQRPFATNYTFGVAANGTTTNFNLRPDLDGTFATEANPLGGRNPYVTGTNVGNFPWFDIDKLAGQITAPNTTSVIAPSVVNGYVDTNEDTKALYAQVNFGRDWLSGNLGVRYVLTDSTIKGPQGSVTNNTFATYNSSYGQFLPELNMKAQITRTLLTRVGFAKTLTRPNFADSKVATSFDPVVALQNGVATVNAGNPNLKPYTSVGGDASIEWYPSRGSSFAVAGYIKYVDGYQRALTTSGTVLVNNNVLPAIITTTINDDQIRRFSGVEVTARQDLSFLPWIFSNLGVYANWNHSWTTAVENVGSILTGVAASNPTLDISANNFAKDIYNAQIYYNTPKLDIRVVYRYFTVNSQTALAPANYRFIPSGTLDISGGYSLTRNIRLLFSMTNIVYSGARSFVADYRFPDNSYKTNRSVLLGANNAGQVIQAGVRVHF